MGVKQEVNALRPESQEIASEEFLNGLLANPIIQVTFAEDSERVVGFCSVRKTREREVELSGIIVLNSTRGKGIGTRLLRKVIESAKRRGSTLMLVKTEVVNERALGFYRKEGFVESGKTVEKIGRTKVALGVMAKKLRP